MLERSPVRGELVEIADAWRQVQALRSYPPAVSTVLGEMIAAAALLSANLKFNGSIILRFMAMVPCSYWSWNVMHR